MKPIDEEGAIFKIAYLTIFSILAGIVSCGSLTLLTHVAESHHENGVNWEAWVAIGTICLAIATTWLGMETRKLSEHAHLSLQIENTPYLFFDDLSCTVVPPDPALGLDAIQFSLKLHNASKMPIEYSSKCLEVELRGETISLADGKYLSLGGIIPQDRTNSFITSPYQLKNPVPPPEIRVEGKMTFDFDYWRIDDASIKKTLRKTIVFSLFKEAIGQPWKSNWLYFDNPKVL